MKVCLPLATFRIYDFLSFYEHQFVLYFLRRPQKNLLRSHFVSLLNKTQEPISLFRFISSLTFSLSMSTFSVSDKMSRKRLQKQGVCG